MKHAKPFSYTLEEVQHAFCLVKARRGAAGVDRQSIYQFEQNLERELYKIYNRLASGTYFPPPVKAVAIPKKSGGKRILGVPTVADRIAQTVVKLRVEPVIDPLFHQDSYGYRPRKSAQQALAVTRKRCWQYPYVLEFDIVKLFDSIDHGLLLKALRHHGISREVQIYVERWLTAPIQHEDGLLEKRILGTPQGGVVSPLLANLFLHYAFDAWMERVFPAIPFCRYADDGLVHCRSFEEAQRVLVALTARLRTCKLTIHPAKTHIVCCVPGMQRPVGAEHEFSFLGYTFRPRCCTDSTGRKIFTGFVPAMSRSAEKSVRQSMKEFPFVRKRFLSLQDIAEYSRPYLQGWINYYCLFYKTRFERVAAYYNSLLIRWAMCKYKHFRGHRSKARRWLIKVSQRKPMLFPHWKLGWTRMVG